ncbi:MAG: thioredoxin domain-containing protein [Planctomycetes bacterium]|nr:thioredoxin domain-containing protein [Planctomycetota bacterium]
MGQRLSNAQSPFLRAAADHPIDWFEWGREPFEAARSLGKPVLLDVGATWCHWCHEMDRRCYRDPQIAAAIGQRFIAVRVDRDERPDLDARFQAAVAQITGLSGWPLTAFLTPEGDVYFGGTYFPPRPEGSSPGFLQILTWASELYQRQPEKRIEEGRRLRRSLSAATQVPSGGADPRAVERSVLEGCLDELDRRHGGFGSGAKFLWPGVLDLCLRAATVHQNPRAKSALLETLRAMVRGALFDHTLGGFHRYTVDVAWQQPHYEKLLAENAEMLAVLASAAAHFDDRELAHAARRTAQFFREVLRLPSGLLGASTSADGESGEGAASLWTDAEIAQIAGEEGAPLARLLYGSADAPDAPGRPLARTGSLEDAARRLALEETSAQRIVEQMEARMAHARISRARALVDRSIFPSANAAAARALLVASQSLREERFATWGLEILGLLAEQNVHPSGRPLRRAVSAPPLAEDTAAIAEAGWRAFAATGDPRWRKLATERTEDLLQHFADPRTALFRDRVPSAAEPAASWDSTPLESFSTPSANVWALRALRGATPFEPSAPWGPWAQRCARTILAVAGAREPLAAAWATCEAAAALAGD